MKLHKLAGLLLLVVCAACSEDTVTTDPIDLSQVGAADDFTDTRDGHVYKCVRIGDQIWMAENLAYFLPMGAEDGCYTYGQDIYDGASVGLPGNIWGEVARKLLAEWTDRLDESARSTCVRPSQTAFQLKLMASLSVTTKSVLFPPRLRLNSEAAR